MRTLIPVLSILGSFYASPPLWSASVPATEFDGRQQGGTLAVRGSIAGWEFTPLAAIVLDRLGVYDDHASGGFAQAHTIGLWRADGTLLAQVEIPAGQAQPLEGNFRYVDVPTAIRLEAFASYVIAASYADGGSDLINQFANPRFDPNIRFDAIRVGFGAFRLPTGRDASGENRNFGPSFTFVPTMEDPGDIAVEMRFLSGSYGFVEEPMDFALTVTNRSGNPANNVTVRITNSIPGSLPFERISASQGACVVEGGMLSCALGNLAGNASGVVRFGATPQASGTAAFEAASASDRPDPFPANDRATNSVAVYYPRVELLGGASRFEGEPLQFQFVVDPPISRPLTLSFATLNGTALAGQDYVGTNGTLTLAPGEATKTFVIASLDDRVLEPDESFALSINVPQLLVNPLRRAATIVDNDWHLAPYSEDFETGRLSPEYWVPNAPSVALFVTSTGQPHGGTNELALAPGILGVPGGPVSVTLRLNVANYTNLTLSFWTRSGPGSPPSLGLGSVGLNVSVGLGTTLGIPGAFGSPTAVHTHRVIPLDPILAQAPLNSRGIIGITFINNPVYYPPFLGHPGTAYDHSLFIDDVQVTGCPKDGSVNLVQPRVERGAFRFQFPTCPGQDYQVEHQSDLGETQWQPLETISGDGLLKTINVPLGPEPQRFIRVRGL